MSLGTTQPRTPTKKLLGDRTPRPDYHPTKPQSLCMSPTPYRADHFVFKAKLAGNEVEIMIDSGANRSYASERTGKLLQHLQYDKTIPYPLTMANGQTVGWINKEIRTTLQIGEQTEQIALDITRIPKYDVVLGMAWLQEHNPQIDWKTRQLTFPPCSTEKKMGGRSPSKVPVVKAIWVRPHGRTLAGSSVEELPPEYKNFEELFKEREGTAALPEHKPWDHKIALQEGAKPRYQGWIGRFSQKEEEAIKEHVEKLLAQGFIRKSHSEFSHGVLLAPKKDGTLRPCIDFRPLNAITTKWRYPLPRIDDIQDGLLKSEWFTTLDILNAYYTSGIRPSEPDMDNTSTWSCPLD